MIKKSFRIRIAGKTAEFVHRHDLLPPLCDAYRTEDAPDFTVEVTAEMADRYLPLLAEESDAYRETVAAHAALCEHLWVHNVFCVHAAAIEMDGKAYLFAAPSGTGKSTHIAQWGRRFGRRVTVINGDKPLLRLDADGKFYVCGSPWCGKEGWQTNMEAPLAGICFLERAERDFIERLDTRAVLPKLFLQVAVPSEELQQDACFALLDRLVSTVPCYRLGCTVSVCAAETAYYGMNPQEEDR